MNTSTKNGSDVKDAPNPEEKVYTIAEVKSFLQKDLHTCLIMLQAVHDDQDALLALATVMHGKYLNHRHKQSLANQDPE